MITESRRGFQTSLYFFQNDECYRHEKPYGFKVPPDGYPCTNIKADKVDNLWIEDMRGSEKTFTVERNGFTVVYVDCKLAYEDYHDIEKIQPYFRELEVILTDLLGAKRVEVFR